MDWWSDFTYRNWDRDPAYGGGTLWAIEIPFADDDAADFIVVSMKHLESYEQEFNSFGTVILMPNIRIVQLSSLGQQLASQRDWWYPERFPGYKF